MIEVTNAIRSLLIAEPNLMVLLNNEPERIRPVHPDIQNPAYPHITICRLEGGSNERHLATELIQQIDVWSKNGPGELWDIYQWINLLMNSKELPGVKTLMVKEIFVSDNFYNPDTMIDHLVSKYKVIVK